MRLLLSISFGFVTSFAAPPAHAQGALLSGEHVRYVAMGADGTLICPAPECGAEARSMQYAVGADVGCDVFTPGSALESFTLEAQPSGGSWVSVSNRGGSGPSAQWTPVSGPTRDGLRLVWEGLAVTSELSVSARSELELLPDEHVVRLSVTLRNDGALGLDELFYLRNADPDHAACNIGAAHATRNDVRLQPPADASALVTARAQQETGTPVLVLGVGAHDSRARVHGFGFGNVDASGTWASPGDPEGREADASIAIAFREGPLAAGAEVRFEWFYVWGSSVAEVEARFEALRFEAAPCESLAEDAPCVSSGGGAGRCVAGLCCTGCRDGERCRVGASGRGCGLGGAACLDCDDGVDCSSERCTLGTCANPDAPSGAPCEDGLFCTAGDQCDGARVCVGGPSACDDGESCTTDTCVEASRQCRSEVTSGCIIGGECVAPGAINPSYRCETCVPSLDAADWSVAPEGSACGPPICTQGRVLERACDTAGVCAVGAPVDCPSSRCESAERCAEPCTSGDCEAGERCDVESGVCRPLAADGAPCSTADGCESARCVDGVCCGEPCEGLCVRCDVPGAVGSCAPVAAERDPDAECEAGCDGAGACRAGNDAGSLDAGVGDAGEGEADAGIDAGLEPRSSGGCAAAGDQRAGGGLWVMLALASWWGRRRR